MTRNQILYQQMIEQNRSNLAKEFETNRSNKAQEDIARDTLSETKRANVVREQETERSHLAQELETHRANTANESLKREANAETKRSNLANELERNRSNRAQETVQVATLAENTRAHKASELEQWRANTAREAETNRANVAHETETAAHNRATEQAAINELVQRYSSQATSKEIQELRDAAQIYVEQMRQNGMNERQIADFLLRNADKGIDYIINMLKGGLQ